jgi:hypothetical protein
MTKSRVACRAPYVVASFAGEVETVTVEVDQENDAMVFYVLKAVLRDCSSFFNEQ